MKSALVIIFIFCLSVTFAQRKPIKGFLFPLLDVGTSTRRSFFVPCEIDPTFSFEENLKKMRNDTLVGVSFKELAFDTTSFVKNEMDKKSILILPVEVIFGEWSIEARAPFLSSFVEYPIEILGQRIVSGYNEKKSYYITHLKMFKRH